MCGVPQVGFGCGWLADGVATLRWPLGSDECLMFNDDRFAFRSLSGENSQMDVLIAFLRGDLHNVIELGKCIIHIMRSTVIKIFEMFGALDV